MSWVLIRADASVLIGSGHIMRCLSLANGLKIHGKSCVFAARNIPDGLAEKLKILGHDIIILKGDNEPPMDKAQGQYGKWLGTSEIGDADTLLTALAPYIAKNGMPELIICDHYALGAQWEKRVGQSLKAPIAAIDDLSDRVHDCQWLIDTTYGKIPADYQGLVPKNCQTLIGSKYALLRPEFAKMRPKSLTRRDVRFKREDPVGNVLISMGGMDKDNVSRLMLEAIAALPETPSFETHILVGSNCPHLSTLRSFAETLPFDVTIHAGVDDVTPLLMAADICIGAAGSSTWERCCLGLPTINIILADNQKTIARKMAERGAVIDAGFFSDLDIESFSAEILAPLLANSLQRQELSLACRSVCNGHGVTYVAESLEVRTVKHSKIIALTRARSADIKTVYEWQCLPETRRFANTSEIPKWDEHTKWMQNKLTDPNCYFYIIKCNQTDAGVVRLDRDTQHGEIAFTVSIFISPEFFGLGVASAALCILAKFHSKKKIFAQVHDTNKSSIALFLRAGYEPQNPSWYMLPPTDEV